MEKKTKVLFLCTESPVRGAMAEGFLQHVAADEFICAIAGVDAASVHPLAVEVMRDVGIDITTQHIKATAEQPVHFRRTRDEIELRVHDFVKTVEEWMAEQGVAH